MDNKYQTIDQFLYVPFGIHNNISKAKEYDILYSKNKYKIKLISHTVVDNSYYFYLRVPSKSQSKKGDIIYHDVVIRFFTDDEKSLESNHIRDYYLQFFSNSPGFIYKYAVLYKKYGYLIEFLYNKLDPQYFDKLPKNIGEEMDLSFDRSIYFACKYLSEYRFRVLNKSSISIGKKLESDVFFKQITDYKTVTFNNELRNLSKKSLNELEKKISKHNEEQRKNDVHRKNASKSTTGNIVKKIQGKKSTSTVNRVIKKVAKKTTKKY